MQNAVILRKVWTGVPEKFIQRTPEADDSRVISDPKLIVQDLRNGSFPK